VRRSSCCATVKATCRTSSTRSSGESDEATRGDGVLHPLWDDYVATSNQQELLTAIAGVINTLLSAQEQTDRDALHF
jgi:hypothetical protein